MKADVDYKFRISCRMHYGAKPSMREFEFQYKTLRQARKNYKAILLDLYRKKGLIAFVICLNRCRDPKWETAIFEEIVP
jgi:hypothetical protein